jgi:hypothetical protein
MQPLSSDVDLSVIAWTSATGPLLSRVAPALLCIPGVEATGIALGPGLVPSSVTLGTAAESRISNQALPWKNQSNALPFT